MPYLDDDDMVEQEAMQDAVWAAFCGGLTVSEAAEQYGLDVSTVRRACERGQVSARLVGKTWLINTTSAHERWGVSRPKRGRRSRP
jgi:excisionase family DNA binding protein